jgi:hypothetical protein
MLPDPILLFEADQRSNAIRMLFFMMILAACLLFMSACASTQTTTASSQTQIFRSEDYVVYQLKTSQSPAELAEKFLGGPQRAWIIEEANPDIRFRRGNAVVIPLKERNRGGLSADGFQTIPILTYHRFAENCSSPLCMPARTFERQMRYLKDNGYHVITVDEIV